MVRNAHLMVDRFCLSVSRHLMTNPAIVDHDGHEIPEGISTR